jgi:hypothetical protein
MLDHLRQYPQRSALRGLVSAYLERFDASKPEVRRLGEWIKRSCPSWTFYDADDWRERSSRFDLFDSERGPRLLAESLLTSENIPRALDRAGLGSVYLTSDYLAAAFAFACAKVGGLAGQEVVPAQNALIAWAAPAGELLYDRCWPDFFRALLQPWDDRKSRQAASLTPTHRTKPINGLIGFAGDPRTGSAGRWKRVRDDAACGDAYAVLMRWLTRASVSQFLDIVDKTADPDMWAYRRAFWTSYLTANHIDKAWVAFAENGVDLAKDAMRRTQDQTLGQFATIDRQGSTRTRDHCALIIQIGDLTIADWSHNGKYNVWRSTDANKPQFFKHSYLATSLESPWLTGSHSGSASSAWQYKLAEVIYQESGRRVSPSEWEPRRARR